MSLLKVVKNWVKVTVVGDNSDNTVKHTSSGAGVDILLAVDQASILGEKWFTIARMLCRFERSSLQESLCKTPELRVI